MRFLIDIALSSVVATSLQQAGHDAQHVATAGWRVLPTRIFLTWQRGRTVWLSPPIPISARCWRCGKNRKPSVILFRGATPRRPDAQAALLIANLPALEILLAQGAVVVIEPARIRVRSLPIMP